MVAPGELDYLIGLCQRCFPEERATRDSKIGPTALWKFSHHDGGYGRAVYYYRRRLGEVPPKPKKRKKPTLQCSLPL